MFLLLMESIVSFLFIFFMCVLFAEGWLWLSMLKSEQHRNMKGIKLTEKRERLRYPFSHEAFFTWRVLIRSLFTCSLFDPNRNQKKMFDCPEWLFEYPILYSLWLRRFFFVLRFNLFFIFLSPHVICQPGLDPLPETMSKLHLPPNSTEVPNGSGLTHAKYEEQYSVRR